MLVATVALAACAKPPEPLPDQAEQAHLPFDNSTGFLDGFSLRVARDGSLFWNSQPVSDAVLSDWLRELAALPREAGALFVAFEPGIAPARATWVRKQVIENGLCKQQRCFEVGWDVKRPVVN